MNGAGGCNLCWSGTVAQAIWVARLLPRLPLLCATKLPSHEPAARTTAPDSQRNLNSPPAPNSTQTSTTYDFGARGPPLTKHIRPSSRPASASSTLLRSLASSGPPRGYSRSRHRHLTARYLPLVPTQQASLSCAERVSIATGHHQLLRLAASNLPARLRTTMIVGTADW